MQKTYNWGIIGTGWIAEKFAEALKVTPNGKLYAIASRDLKKAESFAGKFKAQVAYGSYEEITTNKNVDIIYIATPHNLHCENTLMCLEKGYHVLCEKPFAINAREVNKMVNLARKKDLFLMEAMWTAFLPSIAKIRDVIKEGLLGKIQLIRADLCFRVEKNPENRFYNLKLGGGSLLDLGIYPAFLALEVLGRPLEIKALASIGKTGADENCSFIFKYRNGAIASLFSSIIARSGVDALIIGDKARIHMQSLFYCPTSLSLISNDGTTKDITPEYEGNGYNYEAVEVMKCLDEGLKESTIMPLEKSMQLIEILDEIRKQLELRYPDHDIK